MVIYISHICMPYKNKLIFQEKNYKRFLINLIKKFFKVIKYNFR